jgi:5-formyltetrahydrofolate cyclo-ligase
MVFESKNTLRKIYRQKRAELSSKQRKVKNRLIEKNFFANIPVKSNSVIAGYIAYGAEVNIELLLDLYSELGHIICLPCIEEENSPLTFRQYKKGIELITHNKYGIKQLDSSFPEVFPNIIITPLVAFDSSGSRIGQGGGFYDRTFENLTLLNVDFLAVGVAYKCQQTHYIPTNSYDHRLDAIITEERVFTF